MNDVQVVTEVALSLLHHPYKWGGDKPWAGFDCSGLVIELLKSVGVLPFHGDWTAQGLVHQLTAGGAKVVSTPQEGDLVFFGSSQDKISHVGYCLNRRVMLEAGGGDSSTTTRARAQEQDARIRVRPINSRKGIQAIVRPAYLGE